MFIFLRNQYDRIFERRNIIEAFIYCIIYVLNRLFSFEAMRLCLLESKDVNTLSYDRTKFDIKRITPKELKNYSYNKQRITDEDIKITHQNNDVLYIITLKNSQKIISYGWYSPNPTVINNRFILSFSDDYLYMYNGYTECDYRGFRLHALGMQQSASDAPRLGRMGLVSYVNAENYRSIHSCKRLGYRFIGYIFTVKIFNHDYIFHSFGLKKFKIMLNRFNNTHLNKNVKSYT